MQKLLILHDWVLLPNDNVSMSIGHLDQQQDVIQMQMSDGHQNVIR